MKRDTGVNRAFQKSFAILKLLQILGFRTLLYPTRRSKPSPTPRFPSRKPSPSLACFFPRRHNRRFLARRSFVPLDAPPTQPLPVPDAPNAPQSPRQIHVPPRRLTPRSSPPTPPRIHESTNPRRSSANVRPQVVAKKRLCLPGKARLVPAAPPRDTKNCRRRGRHEQEESAIVQRTPGGRSSRVTRPDRTPGESTRVRARRGIAGAAAGERFAIGGAAGRKREPRVVGGTSTREPGAAGERRRAARASRGLSRDRGDGGG